MQSSSLARGVFSACGAGLDVESESSSVRATAKNPRISNRSPYIVLSYDENRQLAVPEARLVQQQLNHR